MRNLIGPSVITHAAGRSHTYKLIWPTLITDAGGRNRPNRLKQYCLDTFDSLNFRCRIPRQDSN